MKKGLIKTIAFYALLIVAVVVAVSLMFKSTDEEKLTYSDVVDYFQNDEVIEFEIDDGYYITLKVDTLDAEGKPTGNLKTVGYQLRSLDLFNRDCSEYYLAEDGTTNLHKYDIAPEVVVPWWLSYLPFLIIVILIATNSTANGKRNYLYPLIPFKAKALKSLVLRVKKTQ